ncbi:MAG: hypothetical protein DIU78_022250 [Pseudomonadota bacterium]
MKTSVVEPRCTTDPRAENHRVTGESTVANGRLDVFAITRRR